MPKRTKKPPQRRPRGSGSIKTHPGRAKPYEAVPNIKDHRGKPLPSRYFAERDDADQYLADLAAASHLNLIHTRDKHPIGQYLQTWLAEVERGGYKPYTVDNYRMAVHKHLLPNLDPNQDVASFTVDQARQLETTLLETLSRDSANNVLVPLSSMFQLAIADGITDKNPIRQMRASRLKRQRFIEPTTKRKLPWKRHHLQRFIEIVSQPAYAEYAAMWLLLAYRGPRQGEARALLWRNIDLTVLDPEYDIYGLAEIEATIYYKDKDHWQRHSTKNKTGYRVLTLNQRLADAFAAHKRRTPWCKPDDLVFPSPRGNALSPMAVNRWLHQICEQHSLPQITAHDFRRMAITRMDEMGISVNVRQEAFGHASAQQNLEYTFVVDERVKAAYAVADRALEQKTG